MAPRLIPPDPDFRSEAERVLWKRLKADLPDDALLAANRRLGSHEDFYEADLVVGLPGQGFVVIEVKGGQLAHTDEGWVQYTHEGPKSVDPAKQADRGKRLLDSYLRNRGWTHGPIRFEHMVAFPDMELGAEPPSPDLPRWQVIGKGDVADAAGKVWDALNHRVTDKPAPSREWVAEAADLLGGRPDPARALLATGQAREDHVTQLTEAQYKVLDFLRANDRIYVRGGPGTGKTWLALEQARRWAKSGDQVLLVCYSVGLSRWLKQAVEAMGDKVARRIHVSTFSAYLVGKGVQVPPDADQDWWDTVLPVAAAPLVTPAFDGVVVDEAQDFADPWWPVLASSLRGRRMFVAGDERQSVFPGRRPRPPVEATEITLDDNLRNTSQICSLLGPMSEERMRHLGGDGPPVRFVPCSTEDAVSTADAVVEGFLVEGHDPASIVLLTTHSRHPIQRMAEESFGGKQGYWDGFGLGGEVFYATVMGFKGLERPVVVLAVDGFHDDVARDVMYTGMSRARDQLVVVGDLEQIRKACGDEVCKRLTST